MARKPLRWQPIAASEGAVVGIAAADDVLFHVEQAIVGSLCCKVGKKRGRPRRGLLSHRGLECQGAVDAPAAAQRRDNVVAATAVHLVWTAGRRGPQDRQGLGANQPAAVARLRGKGAMYLFPVRRGRLLGWVVVWAGSV
ncbi:hypothetical protein N657DRAFT_639860, partial [Parathielavia appendiculata]